MIEKKSFSVLISEHDHSARKQLINYIESRSELNISGIIRNAEQIIEKLAKNNYDLILLDIDSQDLPGVELLKKIKKFPYIIFTSTFYQYAVKAFEMGVNDFLLKPIHRDRFNQVINRFLSIQGKKIIYNQSNELALFFKEKRNYYFIKCRDVIYFSSHGKHTVIHTKEKDYKVTMLLKKFENELPCNIFLRIHKRYIINIHYLSHIKNDTCGQYYMLLKDEDDSYLPIGRSYVPLFKSNNIVNLSNINM